MKKIHKIILFFLLIFVSTVHSQFRNNNYFINNNLTNIKKKDNQKAGSNYSIYFSTGLFIPVRINNDKNIGHDINIGVQKDFSESFSLCFDIDYSYTKKSLSYITKWNNYLLFSLGSKYYSEISKKWKLYAGLKIGTLLVKEGGKDFETESSFPLCFTFEGGAQYEINKNFSLIFKLNDNSRIRYFWGKADLDNFILTTGGICYRF